MKRTWKRLLPAAALLALPCQAVRADEVSASAQAEAQQEGSAAVSESERPSGGGLSVESAPATAGGEAIGGGAATGGGAGIQAGVEGLYGGTGPAGSMAQVGGMGGGSSADAIGVAIPQSVDEAISHALRLNPEVQLARAKVDEARAAYNQTRLKIVAEITQLMRKRDSLKHLSEFQAEQAKAKLRAAVRDYERAKNLSKEGNLSAEFVQQAEDDLLSAKLDHRQKELEQQQAVSNTDAQLLLLIGIEPGGISSAPQQFLGMALGGGTGFAATGGGEGSGMGMIAGGAGPGLMGDANSDGKVDLADVGIPKTNHGAAPTGGGDAGTGTAAATKNAGEGSSGGAAQGAPVGSSGFGGRGSGGAAIGTGAGGMGGGGGAMMGMMGGGGGGGMVTAPAFGRPPIPERQEHLREVLDLPTRLDLTESPLSDVVTLLKSQHEIEIQIGPGVDPARPITMSVTGVNLKELLLLMTDLYPDLCFIVRDYGLLVSTREKGVDLYGAAIPADLPLEVAPPGMQSGGGEYQGGGFQ